MSIRGAHGFDYRGGHDSEHGLDDHGRLVDVPTHRHEVALDFTRLELELAWAASDSLDLVLRAPYDVKQQRASLALPDGLREAERRAIERNARAHHRTETYSGWSDLQALVARRWSSAFAPGDSLRLAAGLTIPVGRTEEDPYALGDRGLEHLHIQFGLGTFAPLGELGYRAPLAGRLLAGGYASGRFPLAENDRSYRGPHELSLGVELGRPLGERAAAHATLSYFRQGFAHWSGVRDRNSGLEAWAAVGGASVRLGRTELGLDLRLPLRQRTLSASSSAFRQGPTLSLRVSRRFPTRP